tara:strand:+ start:623 stop:1003 length:381 start_codon:yes stop_codon:yes gene_type:complete
MSKNNVVKFPDIKINKHQSARNELLAAAQDAEDYVQFMTDVIIEQMVIDGYNMEDTKLIDDLTVTINMLCGAICRVDGIPHFTHDILDAMHGELQKLLDEEDNEMNDNAFIAKLIEDEWGDDDDEQ